MLLRGSNAVGYTSYPDNVVDAFVAEAKKAGVDIFRVFDALNYIDNLKFGVDSVHRAGGFAEGAICYTGDLTDPKKTKVWCGGGPGFELCTSARLTKELLVVTANCYCASCFINLPQSFIKWTHLRRNSYQKPSHLYLVGAPNPILFMKGILCISEIEINLLSILPATRIEEVAFHVRGPQVLHDGDGVNS